MKRFIDDQIWHDPWFANLTPIGKMFWIYLFTTCEKSGVWKVNFKRFHDETGIDVNIEGLLTEINNKKERVIVIDDEYWFVRDYYRFQYGGNPKNSILIGVWKIIHSSRHFERIIEFLPPKPLAVKIMEEKRRIADYSTTGD